MISFVYVVSIFLSQMFLSYRQRNGKGSVLLSKFMERTADRAISGLGSETEVLLKNTSSGVNFAAKGVSVTSGVNISDGKRGTGAFVPQLSWNRFLAHASRGFGKIRRSD